MTVVKIAVSDGARKKTVFLDKAIHKILRSEKKYVKKEFLEKLKVGPTGHVEFRSTKMKNGKQQLKIINLLRLVVELNGGKGKAKGLYPYALDGNKLNCRSENIRMVTRFHIMRQKTRRNNLGFRGVAKVHGDKFKAFHRDEEGRVSHIGLYDTAIEAAKAYNKRERKLFGELAVLNKIPRKKRGS